MEDSTDNIKEKELEEKKQYLTEEIINKGFNTNDF